MCPQMERAIIFLLCSFLAVALIICTIEKNKCNCCNGNNGFYTSPLYIYIYIITVNLLKLYFMFCKYCLLENPPAVSLQQNSGQKTQQVKHLCNYQKILSQNNYWTISSHIFPQRGEETLIYSAVIFAIMKTDGGTMDPKLAQRAKISAAVKALGLD